MSKEEIQFFKEMAQKDLLSFCVFSDKFFEIARIHEILSENLSAFMLGKKKKLILQLPPRSWKTRMISEAIAWSFWQLERTDVIYTGHSVNLLETISRNIRERVNSPEYKQLFKSRIKSGNESVWDWSMDNGNHLMVYWVTWGITGKGGHRLIIDDPYATRQDAESDTIRKRVEEWYDSTFLSRRHNENAGICIIMQRWREDDLVWYITSREDDWEIVTVPAISDEWISFWESRFSVEYLEEVRRNIWEYFFQSQYQQDPINEWGWDFKKDMFSYADELEIEWRIGRMDIVTFVDPAISQKQEADFTAIVTIWRDSVSNNIYVLEAKHLKTTPDEIINELFNTSDKYKAKWKSYRVGIEIVQYQKMLALEVKNQMRVRDKFFILDEINPQGEKVARIRSIIQPRYATRAIIHRNSCQNIWELELELLKFPNAKHDDLIDSLASAVSIMQVNANQKPQQVYSPSYDWI